MPASCPISRHANSFRSVKQNLARGSDRLASNLGPAVGGPFEGADGEARAAASFGVVEVVAEEGTAGVFEDARVAGTDEAALGCEEWEAATGKEVDAIPVKVRA